MTTSGLDIPPKEAINFDPFRRAESDIQGFSDWIAGFEPLWNRLSSGKQSAFQRIYQMRKHLGLEEKICFLDLYNSLRRINTNLLGQAVDQVSAEIELEIEYSLLDGMRKLGLPEPFVGLMADRLRDPRYSDVVIAKKQAKSSKGGFLTEKLYSDFVSEEFFRRQGFDNFAVERDAKFLCAPLVDIVREVVRQTGNFSQVQLELNQVDNFEDAERKIRDTFTPSAGVVVGIFQHGIDYKGNFAPDFAKNADIYFASGAGIRWLEMEDVPVEYWGNFIGSYSEALHLPNEISQVYLDEYKRRLGLQGEP